MIARHPWKRVSAALLLLSLTAMLLAACGGGDGSTAGGKVRLEFFQNKSEAKGTYDKLIADFNASQPDIFVEQVNPPDAETVLLTRVVKEDLPDIVGMGATDTFAILARSGVFTDFKDDPLLEGIRPVYTDMLSDLAGNGVVGGIPYAANAAGVLYNRTLFKELGLTVPQTWDEFIATAEKIKAAGKTPFYHTYKDAWTAAIPFNALAANLAGPEFFPKKRAGEATFREAYSEVADKQLALVPYGHADNFGKTYADGNRGFANGESVMYLQGNWTIPEIKKANPNVDVGMFALPAGNDSGENKLVSGVDVLLTIPEDTPHKEEARRFIEFLQQPESIAAYIEEQNAFAAREGIRQDDPSVTELQPYFDTGRIVDFMDHYVPAAMQLNTFFQPFLQSGDKEEYLRGLDNEWDKVQRRR